MLDLRGYQIIRKILTIFIYLYLFFRQILLHTFCVFTGKLEKKIEKLKKIVIFYIN